MGEIKDLEDRANETKKLNEKLLGDLKLV